MNDLPTTRLGKSGLQLTRIGFGGIPIQRLGHREAVGLIRHALEQGINWIDTANGYGTSEERVGAAIAGYPRSEILLFTKGQGQDPQTLREQIQLSLSRLRTEYLDLFQFHIVPDPDTWKSMQENGTVDLVLEYREKGLLRHVGASAHTRETALALLADPHIEVLQYPFNFIVESEGQEIIEGCRRTDIGFIAMKPFAGGALGEAALCIRFLLGYPDVVTDPGFERREEVDEVLSIFREGAPLTGTQKQRIEELRRELGTRFCRRCGYCSPCPQGVSIITLMTMDSLVKRFPVDRLSEGWIAEAGASVQKCIECGECEEKCPYDLPIIRGIREGAAILRQAVRAAEVRRRQ